MPNMHDFTPILERNKWQETFGGDIKEQDQRIAIALACGWRHEIRKMYAGQKNYGGFGYNTHLGLGDNERKFTNAYGLPDYLNDLNAMHEAEETLSAGKQIEYAGILKSMTQSRHWAHVGFDQLHATAAQRAEAFLRAFGKWNE